MTPADLAANNTGLVYKIADQQQRRWGGDYDDLVGDGMVGLMKASRGFDPDRGYAFSTYAWRCIEHAMLTGRQLDRRSRGEWSRTRGTRTVVSLDQLCDDPDHPLNLVATDDIEASVVAADQCAYLLGHLTPEQRDAAVAAEHRGDATALADRLGVTRTTIYNRRLAAKRLLEPLVAKEAAG